MKTKILFGLLPVSLTVATLSMVSCGKKETAIIIVPSESDITKQSTNGIVDYELKLLSPLEKGSVKATIICNETDITPVFVDGYPKINQQDKTKIELKLGFKYLIDWEDINTNDLRNISFNIKFDLLNENGDITASQTINNFKTAWDKVVLPDLCGVKYISPVDDDTSFERKFSLVYMPNQEPVSCSWNVSTIDGQDCSAYAQIDSAGFLEVSNEAPLGQQLLITAIDNKTNLSFNHVATVGIRSPKHHYFCDAELKLDANNNNYFEGKFGQYCGNIQDKLSEIIVKCEILNNSTSYPLTISGSFQQWSGNLYNLILKTNVVDLSKVEYKNYNLKVSATYHGIELLNASRYIQFYPIKQSLDDDVILAAPHFWYIVNGSEMSESGPWSDLKLKEGVEIISTNSKLKMKATSKEYDTSAGFTFYSDWGKVLWSILDVPVFNPNYDSFELDAKIQYKKNNVEYTKQWNYLYEATDLSFKPDTKCEFKLWENDDHETYKIYGAIPVDIDQNIIEINKNPSIIGNRNCIFSTGDHGKEWQMETSFFFKPISNKFYYGMSSSYLPKEYISQGDWFAQIIIEQEYFPILVAKPIPITFRIIH